MKETPPGRTIYIIDDDPIFQFSVKEMIKRVAPFIKPFVFDHGKAAMDYIKQIGNNYLVPDIILLDINMPEMDGWAFLKNYFEIKGHYSIYSTSIYLVSGVLLEEAGLRAKQNNLVKDFILKPVTGDKLRAIITV
jgi:CheY-like chemotaxis protein